MIKVDRDLMMALFFDQEWFDARLGEKGKTRADAAAALRVSASDLDEIWKDQRELRVADVLALAGLLGVQPREVATRAGVSTPLPPDDGDAAQRLAEMNERLNRIERMVIELKTLILAQQRR